MVFDFSSFYFYFYRDFYLFRNNWINFCNLNENTRNKIAERAKETKIEGLFPEEFPEIELSQKDEDEIEEKKVEKKVEIVPGYIIYI